TCKVNLCRNCCESELLAQFGNSCRCDFSFGPSDFKRILKKLFEDETIMATNPRADKDSMAKIHRRERFADFAHTLARIEWQFFTTHTFNNPLPRPYVRGSMFW